MLYSIFKFIFFQEEEDIDVQKLIAKRKKEEEALKRGSKKRSRKRSSSAYTTFFINSWKEKQAKNRNETGSDLSLGTRLTRVKRLSRKISVVV